VVIEKATEGGKNTLVTPEDGHSLNIVNTLANGGGNTHPDP